jgi:transcription termination factor Rho
LAGPLSFPFLAATVPAPGNSSPVDIAELKRKSVNELQDMADGLKIPGTTVASKPELIFRIEQNLLDSDVALHGEGVLEILPEGYGFLRSQDYSYLAGPDDIYV